MAVLYPNCKQLNDSLYCLYEPHDPNVELVFFHGFVTAACGSGDMHTRDWMTSSGECWPAEWLQKEVGFPKARVLSVKYDSSLTRSGVAGMRSMETLIETLAMDLILLSCGNIAQTGLPVVLVGHDLGGLVIKGLCVYLDTHKTLDNVESRKFERFLTKVKGVFYFATPHEGLVPDTAALDGKLAQTLEIHNPGTAQLNEKFWKLRRSRNWETAGVGPLLGDLKSPVREATWRYDTDVLTMVERNRECINKPDSRLLSSYQVFVSSVTNFLRSQVEEVPDEEFQDFMTEKVGLGYAVEQVISLFSSLEKAEGRTNVVLLHGMAGIGKTTLGDALYLKLSKKFDPDCRCSVDREATSKPEREISKLQKSILRCLSPASVQGSDQKQMIRTLRKCYKDAPGPLLIFIDNIEEDKELKEIFPGNIDGLLPAGSYILIASRNLGMCTMLEHLGVRKVCSYRVTELDEHSAKELFSRALGPRSGILQGGVWEDVREVLKACSGLPLALEVVGAALANESCDWTNVLEKLKSCIPLDGTKQDSLQKSLEFSYNQLGEALGEREGKKSGSHMKLHVGNYTNFQEIDFPTERCQDRCAVLVLHGMRSFPTFSSININGTGSGSGLLEEKAPGPLAVSSWWTGIARSLRVLILRDVHVRGTFGTDDLPENLECFICYNSTIPFPRGDLRSLKNLKHLEITTKIDKNDTYMLPDAVQKVRLENPRMRELTFASGCRSLKRVLEFGLMSATNLLANIQIDQFQTLKKLVLRHINGLDNNLPAALFQMNSLESHSIQYCEHVSFLPDFHMESLEHLHLALPSLTQLPESLHNLGALRSLALEDCRLLQPLPPGTGTTLPPNLTVIAIDCLSNLIHLPSAFLQVQTMTDPSAHVLELQLPNSPVHKWQYFARQDIDQLDSKVVEDAFAARHMPRLMDPRDNINFDEQLNQVVHIASQGDSLFDKAQVARFKLDVSLSRDWISNRLAARPQRPFRRISYLPVE